MREQAASDNLDVAAISLSENSSSFGAMAWKRGEEAARAKVGKARLSNVF
jgi:hypothetical protein